MYAILLTLLILIIFLIIILFIPLDLEINHNKNLEIKLKVFILKITLYSNKKKKNTKNKSIVRSNNSDYKNIFSKVKKQGIINSIKAIYNFLSTSGKLVKDILKKTEINDFTFILKIGGENSFNTALTYGQASALVYSSFGILYSLKRPKNYQVKVMPDFTGNKNSFVLNLEIKFKLIYLISSLLKYSEKLKTISKIK